MPDRNRRLRARLVWSTALASGAVVAATLSSRRGAAPATATPRSLSEAYRQATKARQYKQAVDKTKNAISRSAEPTGTKDPTTPAAGSARRGGRRGAARRAGPDARRKIPKTPPRQDVPQDRYAMAGGCYAHPGPGRLGGQRDGSSYATTGSVRVGRRAVPLPGHRPREVPPLRTHTQHFVASDGSPVTPTVTAAGTPSDDAVWTVQKSGGFTFTTRRRRPAQRQPADASGRPSTFTLRLTDGCAEWPEITDNITGRTFAGISPFQEVRGTTDAHTHGMAFEFLGGDAHCGRPWSPFGVTVALVDCPDH